MGILDFLTQPSNSFYGLLNNSGSGDAALNSVPGFSMRAPDDPFADLDRQQKEELAKKAAAGVFVNGAPAVPQAGISGQMAMEPGPFGALAQMQAAPIQPAAPAAQAPVPMPQPRPVAVPAAPDAEDAAIPPNAQSTQGQLPTQGQVAPPPRPNFMDGMNNFIDTHRNQLMGLAAGLAGAPSIGAGISRGLTGASAGSQLDIRQAMQQGAIGPTYTALVKAGVPKEQALAAVYNPKILEAVTQSYITDRGKNVQIIKDAMGNEHPYELNKYPKDGEPVLKPIDLGNGAGTNNPTSSPAPNYDPETHRDEAFLGSLDPTTAAAVKDIADGKMPGTGRNLQKLMPYVARYENGFDNTTYQARQNLQKSYFGGGEGGKALRSANTTIDHGLQLKKAIDDLGNYSALPAVLNPVTGKIAEQAGNKKYQDALARFDTNSELYAKELEFALTGKTTVSGTNHIREMFDRYGSPVKNQASLQQTLEMLQQRVNEHENTYNTGMNHKGAAPFDMLTRRGDLDKMLGQDTGSGLKTAAAPPAAPVTATGPNGHKIALQNGRWVDVQTGQPVQ